MMISSSSLSHVAVADPRSYDPASNAVCGLARGISDDTWRDALLTLLASCRRISQIRILRRASGRTREELSSSPANSLPHPNMQNRGVIPTKGWSHISPGFN